MLALTLRLVLAGLSASAAILRQGSGVALSVHARRAHRGQPGAPLFWLASATFVVIWCICGVLVASSNFSGISLAAATGVAYIIVLTAMDWHAELQGVSDIADDNELDAHVSFDTWMWGQADTPISAYDHGGASPADRTVEPEP